MRLSGFTWLHVPWYHFLFSLNSLPLMTAKKSCTGEVMETCKCVLSLRIELQNWRKLSLHWIRLYGVPFVKLVFRIESNSWKE